MKRLIVVVVALVLLAACGSDDDPVLSGADHNDADVEFAQGMIPHHEQAIEMAKLAGTRAEKAEVKDLARRIEAAQGPEIEQLRRWLRSWDEEEDASGGMPGMDMGEGGGGGEMVMSEAEMQQLTGASGAAFDRLFLEMMIRHHESAISMARDEVRDGQFAEAKTLAQRIVDTQQAEIDEMRALLASAPPPS